MIREQWLQTRDHRTAIQLERVRHVVVASPEQDTDAKVGKTVEEQFWQRVVDDSRPGDESRAEYALVSFLHLAIKGHQVAGRIGRIRHHDRDRFAAKRGQSGTDGKTKTVW